MGQRQSIRYFGSDLRPYWRRGGDHAIALLRHAATDHPAVTRRAEAFDAELMADLRRVGGRAYAELAALAGEEGNAEFAQPYLPMLGRWADYLAANGVDPTNQLCSADMFGHLPRNANLALEAILGLGAFAQLAERAGQPETSRRYAALARDAAALRQQRAGQDDHTLLAYGQPGTWSQKHNLIWDRILDTRLFPDSVADREIAWYLRVQKPFGLPVDNRTDTSLLDWSVWSISLARSPAEFATLLAPLHRYAHEAPARVPLSDWFSTVDAKQRGFQARPVVGGVFMRLLADPEARAKWTKRGPNTRGPWAPLVLDQPRTSTSPPPPAPR